MLCRLTRLKIFLCLHIQEIFCLTHNEGLCIGIARTVLYIFCREKTVKQFLDELVNRKFIQNSSNMYFARQLTGDVCSMYNSKTIFNF